MAVNNDIDAARTQRLILAAVESNTLREAFAACNLSNEKGYKIMDTPEFKRGFARATQKLMDAGIRRLAAHSGKAVEKLLKLMDSDNEAIQIKAISVYFAALANQQKLLLANEDIQDAQEAVAVIQKVIEELPQGVREHVQTAMRDGIDRHRGA